MEIPIKKTSSGTLSPSNATAGRNDFFGKISFSERPNKPGTNQISSPGETDNSLAMKIVDYIVKLSIYLTVFLLPLFFLSVVPSVLELNKQIFLVGVVGIGFLAWVGKMAWKNEIRFKKNFILIPLLTFLAIYGVSTVFSNYTEQSLWGYFGGESKSFVSLLFFVALFLLISNNVQSRKESIRIIVALLIGGSIVGLYGVLQIWGKFMIPSEITKNVSFNTIGSVYSLAVYAAALLLMTLALFMDNVSKVLKVVLVILSFFFFFVLMIVNFKLVWFALLIGIALLIGAGIVRSNSSENQSRVLPMIFLVLSLMMVLIKKPIIQKELPIEILLNYKTSSTIALQSLKQDPLLGSGPATYSNVYQKNRPSNLGDFWSVNFNDGTSYFLTLIPTVGILGALSFLFLVLVGVVYLFRGMSIAVAQKDKSDFMVVGAGSVWLFMTIIFFLYVPNMATTMLWWVTFALFISFIFFNSGERAQEFVTTSSTPRSSLSLSFVFVLLIICFITAIYMETQKYVAAAYFNQALLSDTKNDGIDKVSEKVQQAIEMDPNRDIYYRNLSVALFALANQRVSEKKQDLSAEDTNYISTMIKGALQSADKAASTNPNDAENYLALAQVYEGVLATMDKADEQAIDNYQKAIKTDPYNPAIYYKLANVYATLSDIEVMKQQQQQQQQQGANAKSAELPQKAKEYIASAKQNVEESLKLKVDYVESNLLMASLYEREGNLAKAIEKEKENKNLYPTAPGIAFRLGVLYYKSKDLDKSKIEFEYAISLDKNYSNARYFLGLILDEKGDKKSALEQFEKILELNSDSEDVKKVVDNLKSGKKALAGLDQNENHAPVEEQLKSAPNDQSQPEINPQVENQEIPADATPSPDEVDSSDSASSSSKKKK